LDPPPASEEQWEHRISKRHNVISKVKSTEEYKAYIRFREPASRLEGEPQTPKPLDRSLSKRRWEYEIQQWRTSVKKWLADNHPELAKQIAEAAPNEEESPAGDDDGQ